MIETRDAIGVVVIGRNEGERLRRCLTSIPVGLPVIYVDSASTDNSVEIALASGAEVIDLDLSVPFTAARARNTGFSRLVELDPDLDYVQFLDGDCELEAKWLTEASDFLMRTTRAAAVCGRRRERFPDRTIYNQFCDQEWDTPVGEAAACGGDVLMRIDVFRAEGGYDPALIAGEEPELCRRLRQDGWQIWRLDAPMTIHDAAMDRFSQWWKRALRSGYGYAQVWDKTRRAPGKPLYGRELTRALFWILGIALIAMVAVLIFGMAAVLVAPLLWALEVARLSSRHGITRGCYLLLSKVAEFLGAVRYVKTALIGNESRAIYYK